MGVTVQTEVKSVLYTCNRTSCQDQLEIENVDGLPYFAAVTAADERAAAAGWAGFKGSGRGGIYTYCRRCRPAVSTMSLLWGHQ